MHVHLYSIYASIIIVIIIESLSMCSNIMHISCIFAWMQTHTYIYIYTHMLNVQIQYIQRVMCLQLNIMCNIYIYNHIQYNTYIYIYWNTYIYINIDNYSRYSEPCPSDPIPAWASEGLDLTVQCRHLDDDVVCRHGPLDLWFNNQ